MVQKLFFVGLSLAKYTVPAGRGKETRPRGFAFLTLQVPGVSDKMEGGVLKTDVTLERKCARSLAWSRGSGGDIGEWKAICWALPHPV